MSGDEELARLRAEIARLRAGESDEPVHGGTELTPGQWIHRWNNETAEERLQRVTHIRTAFQVWRECEQQDHAGLLAELEALRATERRVRQVASRSRSSMGRVDNYVPVADLRAALDGGE